MTENSICRNLYVATKRRVSDAIIAGAKQRRYIFCATTGRSGTHTLHQLFQSLPNVNAKHEPTPICNGEFSEQWNSGDAEKLAKFKATVRDYKLPWILLWAGFSRIYFEANHQFIKTFASELARIIGSQIQVIILRRPILDVATSMFHRGDIPGKPRGNRWYLDPAWAGNLINASDLLQDKPFDHDFFNCVWYCVEIEARISEFQSEYPSIATFELTTEELNSLDKLLELAEWMGLTEKAKLRLSQKYSPLKADASDRQALDVIDVDSAEVSRFVSILNARFKNGHNGKPMRHLDSIMADG